MTESNILITTIKEDKEIKYLNTISEFKCQEKSNCFYKEYECKDLENEYQTNHISSSELNKKYYICYIVVCTVIIIQNLIGKIYTLEFLIAMILIDLAIIILYILVFFNKFSAQNQNKVNLLLLILFISFVFLFFINLLNLEFGQRNVALTRIYYVGGILIYTGY